MKKIITILIIFLSFSFSSTAFAKNIEARITDIKEGKKVSLSETITNRETKKYVIFVKKNATENTKKSAMSLGAEIPFNDENVYGSVMAIPVDLSDMSENEITVFLNKVYANNNVVAISSVAKRYPTAVPNLNDPLFSSSNSYLDTVQWYLSQPLSGNYGIDVKRAWEYLDSIGESWNGTQDIIVAVMDTGMAYANSTKYNQFDKMTDPLPWEFFKDADFTDNIYTNEGETADNGIDDDENGSIDFCFDYDEDNQCDANEKVGYIDDVNGINIVDWGRYWSSANYDEFVNASVCTNEPYASSGVKCIQNPANLTQCSLPGLENWAYLGCYPSDMGHPDDAMGHGTFVSSIISSKGNNATGGVGIASNVSILNVKIFGEYYDDTHSKWVLSSATGDQIANGINYAVEMGATIINMSYAGSEPDYYEMLAIDNAYENDVLMIAASGNNNSSSTRYPAGYSNVLSVGASNKNGTRVTYSNYGTALDLVAPVGTGILGRGYTTSTYTTCSFDSRMYCLKSDPSATPALFNTLGNVSGSGTSFAAPQVTGVAALLRSTYPELKANEIMHILKMTSMPSGSFTYSTSTGHGVLNAYNAVMLKDYKGVVIDKMGRIYENMIGTDSYPYTRYSDNGGVTWSNWIKNGSIMASASLTTVKYPGDNTIVIQVMKGTNNNVYVRYADEFGYDYTNADSVWSSWTSIGTSNGGVNTVATANRIVLSWKGTDNKVYVKYTSDGGQTWTAAATASTTFKSDMATIYNSSTTSIAQIVKGNDNYIYSRKSSDEGTNWSSWIKGSDYVYGGFNISNAGPNIVRAVRIPDNIVVIRYSTDGGATWTGRNRDFGNASISPQSVLFLYDGTTSTLSCTYRGKDNRVYSKYSLNNGVTWTTAVVASSLPTSVYANSVVSGSTTNGGAFQMVMATNGYMYYRKSSDGGRTWGIWRNRGSIKTTKNISTYYDSITNHLLINLRYTDNRIYTKISDDKGSNFGSWNINGYTKSTIMNNGSIMQEFNTSTGVN